MITLGEWLKRIKPRCRSVTPHLDIKLSFQYHFLHLRKKLLQQWAKKFRRLAEKLVGAEYADEQIRLVGYLCDIESCSLDLKALALWRRSSRRLACKAVKSDGRSA